MKLKQTQYRATGTGGVDLTVSVFAGAAGIIHMQDDNNPKLPRKIRIFGAGGNVSLFPFSLDVSTYTAPSAGSRVYRGLKHHTPMSWNLFGGPGIMLIAGSAAAYGTGVSAGYSLLFFGMQDAYLETLLGTLGALWIPGAMALYFPLGPVATLSRNCQAQCTIVGFGARYGVTDVGVTGIQFWAKPLP